MSNNIKELVLITIKDTWQRRNTSLMVFVCLSMSVLLVSFNWPKFYVSTVVIEIDDQNKIGRASCRERV